ncbi:hypothetical protein Q669_02635 [Labrenzia sp. C1B10]|nr:hypothetical protein Q669_02635 [Labrenzia sp. C1B10]
MNGLLAWKAAGFSRRYIFQTSPDVQRPLQSEIGMDPVSPIAD